MCNFDWHERNSSSFEEFALEFNPMQAKGVEATFK
jgi:hypothetical protein